MLPQVLPQVAPQLYDVVGTVKLLWPKLSASEGGKLFSFSANSLRVSCKEALNSGESFSASPAVCAVNAAFALSNPKPENSSKTMQNEIIFNNLIKIVSFSHDL